MCAAIKEEEEEEEEEEPHFDQQLEIDEFELCVWVMAKKKTRSKTCNSAIQYKFKRPKNEIQSLFMCNRGEEEETST